LLRAARGREGKSRGCRARLPELGCDLNWAEAEAMAGCAGRGFGLFFFLTPIPFLNKQTNLNSNQVLNPNTQKQCTGMNATHTTIYLI
jgi:hypothetical protein